MLYLAKIVIAVIVFILVAEISKHSPKWSGLISAMPWITLLVIVTRHQFDHSSSAELVSYLVATFWFILPTLLFVAVMASMLHQGASFYFALTISIAAAVVANGIVAFGMAETK